MKNENTTEKLASMRPIAVLHLHRGKKAIDEVTGKYVNENHIMKIVYGTLEWRNFTGNCLQLGFSTVEVLELRTPDGKDVLDWGLDLVKDEVNKIYTSLQVELTADQKRIKELEAKYEALLVALNGKGSEESKQSPSTTNAPTEPKVDNEDTEEKLENARKQYHELVGKKPFHGWDEATITEKIQEFLDNKEN